MRITSLYIAEHEEYQRVKPHVVLVLYMFFIILES